MGKVSFTAVSLFASIGCLLGSETIEWGEHTRFHQLDITAAQTKKDAVCRQCHMMDFVVRDAAPQLWLRTAGKEVRIRNLEETPEKPDPFSLACLSCHDGSRASLVMNAPVSPCGLKSDAPVGENGANHPVFLKYADQNVDLRPMEAALRGEWSDAKRVSDLLRAKQVVCISCHDPHHNDSSGYLKTTMRGSSLCLGCHDK